jgi:hypothetical protein
MAVDEPCLGNESAIGSASLPSRADRALAFVVLPLGTLAAALLLGREIASRVAESHALPLWDPAKYGAAGARLADRLAGGDPLGFIGGVNELSLWPPGFALLEVPAFLAFGPSYATAQGLMLVLFTLAAAAIALAGASLAAAEDARYCLRPLTGAVATAFFLTSPAAHLFAGLVMLELPGALILVLAVAVYAQATRGDSPRAWRWAAALAGGPFFIKYNYGLLWLGPLALGELAHHVGGFRALATAAMGRLRSLSWWRRGSTRAVAVVLLLLAVIFLLRDAALVLGDREISVSLGNTVFVLYAFATIVVLAWPRRRRAAAAWVRAHGPRAQSFWWFAVLPIGLWLLIPPHLKDLLKFLENRASGPSILTGEGLLFYPRVFLFEMSPHPGIGLAALGLAALSFLRWRALGRVRRTLLLALLVNVMAVTLHPYKEARFLFTVAPLVWLAAALTVQDGFEALCKRAPGRLLASRVAGLLSLAFLVAPVAAGVDGRRVAAGLESWSVPGVAQGVLDEIARHSLRGRGSALIGHWNGLSPGLIEWDLRQRVRGLDGERVPAQPQYLARSRDPGRILERLATSSRVERVLVLDATGDSEAAASFRLETGWLDGVREGISSDPRFRLQASPDLTATGYRLRVFNAVR